MIIHVFIICMFKGVLLGSIINRIEYIQAINAIVMRDALELTNMNISRKGMNLRPPDYSQRNDEEELIVEVPDNIRKTFRHRTGINIPNKYHIMKNKNTRQKCEIRQYSGTITKKMEKIDRQAIFKFDFDSRIYHFDEAYGVNSKGSSISEQILSAELRVYWKPHLSMTRRHGGFRARVYDNIKTDIFSILDAKKIEYRCDEKDEGWYTFDVTSAVKRWIGLKKNQITKKVSNRIMIEKGIVNVVSNQSLQVESNDHHKKFSLVPLGVFEIAELSIVSEKFPSIRTRRGTEDRKRKPWKKRVWKNKDKMKKKRDEERCRLHELQIDFSEIGWGDWIMAPTGLNLNFCSGLCEFPFPDRMNASNHAIIQSLKSGSSKNVPPPCCVPIGLNPVDLLVITTIDGKESVVLKSYPDMEINACGCQ